MRHHLILRVVTKLLVGTIMLYALYVQFHGDYSPGGGFQAGVIFAAGIINGAGHWRGYRNFETADTATNIVPWGIIIGGEELHNNHHAFAISARFSTQWYEFDIGWFYIRLLEILGLAKVLKVAPRIKINLNKQAVDLDTAKAVLGNRLQVLSNSHARLLRQSLKQNCAVHLMTVVKNPARRVIY